MTSCGFSTGDVPGLQSPPNVIGHSDVVLQELPRAERYCRSGGWPPEVAEADLVVNATSERGEVLVELGPGQTLVDLPYPETATGRAAREAGADVITGLEVLVAQGAASFELWTGLPAPIEVMRRAGVTALAIAGIISSAIIRT